MAHNDKDRHSTWFISYIGFNAAMSAHGILLPLYIVSFGGTPRDFGIITAIYNAITIATLVFWGKRSDQTGQRRRFILLGFLGTGILLIFFSLASTPIHLLVTQALLGCFATAGVPVTTMLIIELHPRKHWEDKIGEYNTYCGIGMALGLLLGSVLLLFVGIPRLYLLSSGFTLFSALMGFRLIRDPVISLERHPIVMTRPRLGMVERVRIWALAVHHLPSFSAFTNFRQRIRSSLTQDLPLYYISIFLLFTASNIVFVPLPLILRALGLSGSFIFFFYLLNNVSATTTYRTAVKRLKKLGNARSMFLIAGVRGLMFASLAILAWLPTTQVIGLIGLILILTGLSWAFMNPASSALLLELSPVEHRGRALGGLNAIIGLGVVLGALLGGFITDIYGYPVACVCSAGIQAVGVGVLRIIWSHRKRRPTFDNLDLV
jgi:MFS family permease